MYVDIKKAIERLYFFLVILKETITKYVTREDSICFIKGQLIILDTPSQLTHIKRQVCLKANDSLGNGTTKQAMKGRHDND